MAMTMRSAGASGGYYLLLFHFLAFPSDGYIVYPRTLRVVTRPCFAGLPESHRGLPVLRRAVAVNVKKLSSTATTTSLNNANDNSSSASSLAANAPASSYPSALGTVGDWSAYLDESKGLIYYFNPNSGESRWEAPDDVDFSCVHTNISAAKKVEMRERLKNYLEKRLQESASEFVDEMQKENAEIRKRNNDQIADVRESAKMKAMDSNKKFPLKEKETSNKDIVHEWSTWQALIDNKRGQIYYYNRETYESSWDRPDGFPDFKLSASKRTFMKDLNVRYLEWQTDASQAIVQEENTTVESDSAIIGVVEETREVQYESIPEPTMVQNANNVVEATEGPESNSNQPPSLPIVQQGDWSAYFDIKSGLVFYFNEITSETSWDPPFDNFPRITMDAGGLGPKVLDAEEAGNISMERALGYIGVDEMAEALKWEEAKKKERARKAAKRAKEAEAKGGSTPDAVNMYEAAKQAEVEKLVRDRKIAAELKAKKDAEITLAQQKEESERLRRLQKERMEQDQQAKFVPKQPVRPKEDPTINAVTISTMVAPGKIRTLYDILQCSSNASRSELKRAYISLAKETHPDALLQNGMVNDTETELRFIEISQAWKVLGDTTSRRRYDRELQAKGLSSKAGNLFEAWVMEAAKAMDEVLAVAEDSIESR